VCGELCPLHKQPLTSSELLQQTLGWTTLKIRCYNAMLCQVHHCCIKQAPPYLCSKFTTNSNLNYARTRGSDKLHLPRAKDFHSSFEFQGAVHFNNYQRTSESSRIGSYLQLLYVSITIPICRVLHLYFLFFVQSLNFVST